MEVKYSNGVMGAKIVLNIVMRFMLSAEFYGDPYHSKSEAIG